MLGDVAFNGIGHPSTFKTLRSRLHMKWSRMNCLSDEVLLKALHHLKSYRASQLTGGNLGMLGALQDHASNAGLSQDRLQTHHLSVGRARDLHTPIQQVRRQRRHLPGAFPHLRRATETNDVTPKEG